MREGLRPIRHGGHQPPGNDRCASLGPVRYTVRVIEGTLIWPGGNVNPDFRQAAVPQGNPELAQPRSSATDGTCYKVPGTRVQAESREVPIRNFLEELLRYVSLSPSREIGDQSLDFFRDRLVARLLIVGCSRTAHSSRHETQSRNGILKCILPEALNRDSQPDNDWACETKHGIPNQLRSVRYQSR